jgi:mannose-6-phosphate isomerase-like protein (cupin superfamily)
VSDQHVFNPTVLLRGEDSAGVVSMVEVRVPAGWEGPPLHHHEFDEGFYVLDGELTFQLGDELVTATSGQFAFARGGVHHTLANPRAAEARYLLICTPAGFERYFDRVAAENAGVEPRASAREPSPEVIRVGPRIGERSDLPPARPLEGVAGRIRVLLRGADSQGRVAVMDNSVPAGVKGPPHHHHEFDEGFFVIDGELTFRLGDELVTRRAGELAFAPRGAHHSFANRSDSDARMLLVCTPAGFERYFQRIAAREAGVEPPPEALEPWPEVSVVGPQIGEWIEARSGG